MPNWLIDPYVARRNTLDSPGGWVSPTPYEHIPELRAVAMYPPLMKLLRDLIGEPALLHLSLTGWISTERNWHQDDYLNPEFVNGWYAVSGSHLTRFRPTLGLLSMCPDHIDGHYSAGEGEELLKARRMRAVGRRNTLLG